MGKLLIIDGIDGAGKGVMLAAMREAASRLKALDLVSFWKERHRHPTEEETAGIDIIFSEEPTYVDVGLALRDDLVRSDRNYSVSLIAEAFSLQRHILYERVLLPALRRGALVIQSRGVSASLVYQSLDAEEREPSMTRDAIASLPGNALALSNPPDILVIPTVDAEIAMKRLGARQKQDGAIFEQEPFLRNVAAAYASTWLAAYFPTTRIIRPSTSGSVSETVAAAKRIFRELTPRP